VPLMDSCLRDPAAGIASRSDALAPEFIRLRAAARSRMGRRWMKLHGTLSRRGHCVQARDVVERDSICSATDRRPDGARPISRARSSDSETEPGITNELRQHLHNSRKKEMPQ